MLHLSFCCHHSVHKQMFLWVLFCEICFFLPQNVFHGRGLNQPTGKLTTLPKPLNCIMGRTRGMREKDGKEGGMTGDG